MSPTEDCKARNGVITRSATRADSDGRTPTLLRLIENHQIDPGQFATDQFELDDFMTAYESSPGRPTPVPSGWLSHERRSRPLTNGRTVKPVAGR